MEVLIEVCLVTRINQNITHSILSVIQHASAPWVYKLLMCK